MGNLCQKERLLTLLHILVSLFVLNSLHVAEGPSVAGVLSLNLDVVSVYSVLGLCVLLCCFTMLQGFRNGRKTRLWKVDDEQSGLGDAGMGMPVQMMKDAVPIFEAKPIDGNW